MSHVTSGLITIGDLDILRQVVKDMFPMLEWREEQKTYTWYNRFQDDWGAKNEHKTARARGVDPSQYGHCDHALHLPGCDYEIGITKRNDGTGWSLVWDVWRGHALSACIGEDAEKIMLEYTRATCQQTAQAQGMTMVESVLENGEIEVLLTKY